MRVPCNGNAVVPVLLILTILSTSVLGCGLFGVFDQQPEPATEPDIDATITSAVNSVTATREAASQAESPTPRPTTPPTLTEAPEPAPSTETDGPRELAETMSTVGPESTWGSLFDAFTEVERSCIAAELGEERLAEAMDIPVFGSGPGEGWEPIVFGCLEQETAATLFFILLTAPIGAHMMGRSVLSTGVPLWKNDGIPQDKVDDLLPDEMPNGGKP